MQRSKHLNKAMLISIKLPFIKETSLILKEKSCLKKSRREVVIGLAGSLSDRIDFFIVKL